MFNGRRHLRKRSAAGILWGSLLLTVSPARIRRMESRSIHTASGIEVKIPTEILSEDSAVEFLHAEDGSVSLLIKNVIL